MTHTTIASTSKYSLVNVLGTYRIENHRGPHASRMPHCEIPKSLADQFMTYFNWRENGYDKSDAKKMFLDACDEMFEHEVSKE